MTQPVAFSYIRFSTPEQRKGHSLERQTERAKAWCEKNGIALDKSRTWHDLGRSAYLGDHRSNPDRHALAAFLRLVEEDKIPRGSYLVIEALDRLTREHVRAGLMLCLGLIEKGIKIVQLSPSEIIFDETTDNMSLMMMLCELARGHGESKRKSDLFGPAWRKKKEGARTGGIVTDRLPAWVKVRDGKLELIPERATAVKRIFELTIGGYGIPRIVARLTTEKVPAIGKTGRWVKGYIGRILRDRRAMGEYQPRKGKTREPDGEPVPGYFPAVVSAEVFNAARAGSAQRMVNPEFMVAGALRSRSGGRKRRPTEEAAPTAAETADRRTGKVNIFANLIKNAREGDSYFMTMRTQRTGPPRYHVLINSNSEQGRSPCFAFQYDVFERAALSLLAEIDPREITGEDTSGNEVMALSGELGVVGAKLAELETDLMVNGESSTITKVVRKHEQRKKELVALLREAEQRAASPVCAAWGECRSLLKIMDAAADQTDVRLRVRSAIRRVVDSIWLLVVPRRRDRIAAFQMHFAGGDHHRDYILIYKSDIANASGRKPGGWWVRSTTDVAPGSLDLRNREDARLLEEALLALDLTTTPAAD
jgi:DNA invertase Pin-like site-specific DNA recombinase